MQEQFRYVTDNNLSFYEVETKGNKEFYVEGYISTEDVDLVNDSVTRECMMDMLIQIKNTSIKLDFEHETIQEENLDKNPVGRIVDAKVDNKGLWVKAMINSAHSKFNEIWGSIKNGMLDAFSIAFQPLQKATKYIAGKAIRLLQKVKLINVALTGTPVNSEAKMTNIIAKSLDYLESNEWKSIYNSFIEKGYSKEESMNLTNKQLKCNKKSEDEEKEENLEKMAEQKNISHSTSDTEDNEKMAEEMTPLEEIASKTEEKEEVSEDKEEEKSESESKEAEIVPEVEEEKAEEPKEVEASKVEELEAEVKSLRETVESLNKKLAKPEFKAMAESSPESIKSDNQKKLTPLSLLAQ